jgi:hypothetical protein
VVLIKTKKAKLVKYNDDAMLKDQHHQPRRNNFNDCKYIVSFISEKNHTARFVGVFEILGEPGSSTGKNMIGKTNSNTT